MMARARGSTWFDTCLIELASCATIVTAGSRHVCSYGWTFLAIAKEAVAGLEVQWDARDAITLLAEGATSVLQGAEFGTTYPRLPAAPTVYSRVSASLDFINQP